MSTHQDHDRRAEAPNAAEQEDAQARPDATEAAVLVEITPGPFASMTLDELDRLRICGHEAAHAVATYRVGLRVGRWGVQVGPPGAPRQDAFAYSETPSGGPPSPRRAIAVRIAGPLYEATAAGETIGDGALQDAITEARADPAARRDHPAVFAQMLALDPAADDAALLARYSVAEAEVSALLHDPATRRSIAAVTAALLRQGRLPVDLVESLIEPGALVPDPAFAVTLAEAFEGDRPVFLGFSGGRDSVTLAHLCEPWRERITLVWVNTGHMAPHMVEFVRGYAARGWRLVEIPSPDLFASWRDHGIPADVVSASHVMGWEGQAYQLWPACCFANRQAPANAFLAAQGPCVYLNGQRRDDRGGTPHGLASTLPDHVEVVMPLWDWTEARVQAHVEQHALVLPEQYADGLADSLECLVCPAALRPGRLRYLQRRFPETAERIRPVVRRAMTEAERRVGEVRAVTGAGR